MINAATTLLTTSIVTAALAQAPALTGAPSGGVSPATAAADPASAAVAVNSVWDFVLKGGIMMIPIGLCSLLVLAITVERLLVVRRSNVSPPGFLKGLKEALGPRGEGRDAGLAYCEKSSSPIARIVGAGVARLGGGADAIEKSITAAGEHEVYALRKRLRVLSVIASIAPLLGLLGTIFGMIKAFQTVATSGDALGRTELLAGGIYEALITTAAGLCVAIPALVFYHWINARIESLVRDMDRISIDFVESFAIPAESSAMSPTARGHQATTAGNGAIEHKPHEGRPAVRATTSAGVSTSDAMGSPTVA